MQRAALPSGSIKWADGLDVAAGRLAGSRPVAVERGGKFDDKGPQFLEAPTSVASLNLFKSIFKFYSWTSFTIKRKTVPIAALAFLRRRKADSLNLFAEHLRP